MKDKAVENANVIKDGHEFDAVDPMALEKIAAMTIHEATDLLPHAARAEMATFKERCLYPHIHARQVEDYQEAA